MSTPAEVEAFLREFQARMQVCGVVFHGRSKNLEALLELGIVPNARKKILEGLTVLDFSEGPMKDTLNKGPDLWVFGKEFKELELYIKITLGLTGDGKVVCISFHPSEHPMKFPNR